MLLINNSCVNTPTESINHTQSAKSRIDSFVKKYPINTGDPDTSLAVFLWIDTIPDFDNSIEEYTRLAVDRNKILSLIKELFGTSSEYQSKILDIENRSKQFDNHVKEFIFNEVAQDTTLSDSRELWYLHETDKKLYDSLLKRYPILR